MRLLFWLLLAVIVYFAIRSRARSMQQNLRRSSEFQAQAARQAAGQPAQQAAGQQTSQAASRPIGQAEKMVECAYCHVYLPTSEAIRAAPESAAPSTVSQEHQFFCSKEHMHLHAATSTSNPQPNE